MDVFDLPDEQVRAILATEAGAAALWESRRGPRLEVRCPQGHLLGKVYAMADAKYLSIGPLRQSRRFAGDALDTAVPPLVTVLDGSRASYLRWEIARCKCRSWALREPMVELAVRQRKHKLFLDEEDAVVSADGLRTAAEEIRGIAYWIRHASYTALNPEFDPVPDAVLERLDQIAAEEQSEVSRAVIEALVHEAQAIGYEYVDWDYANDLQQRR